MPSDLALPNTDSGGPCRSLPTRQRLASTVRSKFSGPGDAGGVEGDLTASQQGVQQGAKQGKTNANDINMSLVPVTYVMSYHGLPIKLSEPARKKRLAAWRVQMLC